MSLLFDRLTQAPMPESQYLKKEIPKTQIYLHHTAGNADPYSVIKYWNSTAERVSTAFIIGGKPSGKFATGQTPWVDGEILQCFSSKYSSWHLGGEAALKRPAGSKTANELNLQSIGIELCNWGWLTYKDGKYYNYAKGVVPAADVVELTTPYKGYKFYHRYTDEQLESTLLLLEYLGKTWNIPLGFKGMEIFARDIRAFKGEPGVYTHNSVRNDKWDVSPQPALIEMLKSL